MMELGDVLGWCQECGTMVYKNDFKRFDAVGAVYHASCIFEKEIREVKELKKSQVFTKQVTK